MFVVLPFVVRGPATVQYLGDGMVELLHAALNGVAGVRIEHGASTQRRVGELAEPQNPRDAVGLATELGAGRLIGGAITSTGSDVRIRADVMNAQTGRVLFSVEGRADLSRVTAAVDAVASAILVRRLVPAREHRRLAAGEYNVRSPAALTAYIVARKHIVRGERRAAADSLRSALKLDSTFGLAHLALVRLENAEQGVSEVQGGLAAVLLAARQLRASFSPRVAQLIEVVDLASQGERSRMTTLLRSLATKYPDDADVAAAVADANFHFGLQLGEPRSVVMETFRRALTFHDQDPEILGHYMLLVAEDGDSTLAFELLKRCPAVPNVCALSPGYRAVFRREAPTSIAQARDSGFTGGVFQLLRLAAWDPALGLALTDSFARIQAARIRTPAQRWGTFATRSVTALARGQHELSWTMLDSAQANGAIAPGFRLLADIVTGQHPERVPRTLGVRNADTVTLIAAHAWWAAARGPVDSAETWFHRLEARAWPDSAYGAAMATGLRGLVALRGGDTARALELLRLARTNHKRRAVGNRVILPGVALSLKLAELEAVRGNWTAAKLFLADVYPMNDYPPFIGDAEELRAKVALATNDTIAARTHLRNVIAVWQDADPHLQPRVAAARQTLARLGSER